MEITARVMSLLPLPDLCICRSVCKAWNDLLRRPEFLDLCDRTGSKQSYLFVTGHFNNWGSSWVDGAYRRKTCFLDLNQGRWFSIPVNASLPGPTDANVSRLLAMDDGLICELSVSSPNKLIMFDPIAQTMRALPEVDGPAFCLTCRGPPAIVTVVDNANSSFKVFLLSCRSEGPHTGVFLYESSTDAWRDLGNPVQELGIRVSEVDGIGFSETAVYFQGSLYATFYVLATGTVLLLSYNVEENSWKEVLRVESKNPGYPELVVFGDRLFMAMWLDVPHGRLSITEIIRADYSKRSIFEIREILVNEMNASKSVVQIPYKVLQRIFYGEENEFGLQYDIACGFPISSNSVVLISRHTGKLITYNKTSGCVGALPAHPLIQASLEIVKEEMLSVTFRAKLMKLSLRNILSA